MSARPAARAATVQSALSRGMRSFLVLFQYQAEVVAVAAVSWRLWQVMSILSMGNMNISWL